MRLNLLKIILAVVVVAIIIGGGVYFWQSFGQIEQDSVVEQPSNQSNLKTYSSEKYSFVYPKKYIITLPNQSFPALTVEKAKNARVEIFQMNDFGDRPWGFEGTESQEEIDSYSPKETLTVGIDDKKYNVWLYYSDNDNQTKEELKAIFDSTVIK